MRDFSPSGVWCHEFFIIWARQCKNFGRRGVKRIVSVITRVGHGPKCSGANAGGWLIIKNKRRIKLLLRRIDGNANIICGNARATVF